MFSRHALQDIASRDVPTDSWDSCYVGPGVSPAKRAEALNEFEDPAVRVCLLDLRMAARGL
jgi:hypothetical protein